jgi:hypothetical protein
MSLWVHSNIHERASYRFVDVVSGTENPTTQMNALTEWTGFEGLNFIETVAEECFGISLDNIQDFERDRSGYIKVPTNYSIPARYALEIFSGLVHAITEKLHLLDQNIERRHHAAEYISIALLESRLIDSPEEARIMTYPFFLRRGLLPRRPPSEWRRGNPSETNNLDRESTTMNDNSFLGNTEEITTANDTSPAGNRKTSLAANDNSTTRN